MLEHNINCIQIACNNNVASTDLDIIKPQSDHATLLGMYDGVYSRHRLHIQFSNEPSKYRRSMLDLATFVLVSHKFLRTYLLDLANDP